MSPYILRLCSRSRLEKRQNRNERLNEGGCHKLCLILLSNSNELLGKPVTGIGSYVVVVADRRPEDAQSSLEKIYGFVQLAL